MAAAVNEKASSAGMALVALRWGKTGRARRAAQSELMTKARLAAPAKGGGPWYDVPGLVKAFGHSRGFYLKAIRSGQLKVYKRPDGRRAGKHWASAAEVAAFLSRLSTPKGKG